MLNSKQRAYLRGLGNALEPILQVGKSGLSENLLEQADGALEARELVKLRILKNNFDNPAEIANQLAEALGADVVQVIGRIALIYRPSEEHPTIELPTQ